MYKFLFLHPKWIAFVNLGVFILSILVGMIVWHAVPEDSKQECHKWILVIVPLVPLVMSLVIEFIRAFSDKFQVIDVLGSGVFDFSREFHKFVKKRSAHMEGNLWFYNIPLNTFTKGKLFKDIWEDTVGKNEKIEEIHFLLDNSLKDSLIHVIESHIDFFNKHNDRFLFKFENIRSNVNNNIPINCPYLSKSTETVSSVLNYGVWSSDRGIVTMTGEFSPFGSTNAIHDFIAFTTSEASFKIRISDFVIDKYRNSTSPEVTPLELI